MTVSILMHTFFDLLIVIRRQSHDRRRMLVEFKFFFLLQLLGMRHHYVTLAYD